MGRAHFEQANYAEAARTFAKARAITPLCTEDMDIYSTSLWHLKRDVDLAFFISRACGVGPSIATNMVRRWELVLTPAISPKRHKVL